jgi:hypothetical protein
MAAMIKMTLVDGSECGVPCGYGIEHKGKVVEIVQTDWDYPATAQRFGYRGHRDARDKRRICREGASDGTVKCTCGATVDSMLAAAREYLDANNGKTVMEEDN